MPADAPSNAAGGVAAPLPADALEFGRTVGNALQRAREVARDLPVVGGYVRLGEAVADAVTADFDLMDHVSRSLVRLGEQAGTCSHDVAAADSSLEIGAYPGCAFGDPRLDAVKAVNEKARRSTGPTTQTLDDVAAALLAAAKLVDLYRENEKRANVEAEQMLRKVRASQEKAEGGDSAWS